MPEYKTIQEHIERRTYLKGKFKGKFIGYLDPRKSDLLHENFYDLEVLSGEVKANREDLHHWQTGEPIEYQPLEKFLTKLPDSLKCVITYQDGSVKNYAINLNEPKLSNYDILNQVHDNDKVLGDIVGDISGYIKHYDTIDVEIEIPDSDEEQIDSHIKPTSVAIKTNTQTGNTEVKGNYKRWEYYKSDKSTYWGDWKFEKQTSTDWWGILVGIIQLGFIGLFLIPLFLFGWKLILPLLIIWGIIYLLSIFNSLLVKLWQGFLYLIGIAFILLFLGSLFPLFKNTIRKPYVQKHPTTDDNLPTPKPIPDTELKGDRIISHHRIWNDYDSKTYSANLEVRESNYIQASNFRNNLSYSNQSPSQYNSIVSSVYDFDKTKLTKVYAMFDSLKTKNNLDRIQFCKVITSCIQDIPYTLILNAPCDANLYNDDFISSYLRNGGVCEGNIKYGLLSPVEFVGSLKGDCDTRTLLLFTILNHYNYDVAMLGSELYKHSVIGINLPFSGVAKTINNKQYVLWETTATGFEPGQFPREQSDMRFWNINLISNNQN